MTGGRHLLPIDNTVASAMPTVTQLTREAKIPVYTGADSMVADGGLATVESTTPSWADGPHGG
ncbi:MAG: ABC transporter substrate binding protein [Oscillospiraceae bacterium]